MKLAAVAATIPALAVALVVGSGSADAAVLFTAPGNPDVVDSGSGGGDQLPFKDGVIGVKLFGDSSTTMICAPGAICLAETFISWHGEGVGIWVTDHVDLDISFQMAATRSDLSIVIDQLHANLVFSFGVTNDEDFMLMSSTRDYYRSPVSGIPAQITDTLTVTGIPIGWTMGSWQVTLTNDAQIVLNPDYLIPFPLIPTLTVPHSSIDINPVNAPEPGGALGAVPALVALAGARWTRRRRA